MLATRNGVNFLSFFFDVWTVDGFILASDVRMIIDNTVTTGRKLAASAPNSKVKCAIAVCGDYPENSLNFFHEATITKDSLRGVAHAFAKKWTDRYSGICEFSGVHLVGFEKIPDSDEFVPQMWFWCNWRGPSPGDFHSKETLSLTLSSFSEPIPLNNHIPYKIKELTGKFPGPTLNQEAQLVYAFLKIAQPFFTWNGDTSFWRAALNTVDSAMDFLKKEKTNWSIDEAIKLTSYCLTFLANTGTLLKFSSVGLSPNQQYDMLKITPSGVEKVSWANLQK